MSLLSTLIAIVLGALALAFVLYPFYGRKSKANNEVDHFLRMPMQETEKHANGHTDTSQASTLPEVIQAERELAARNALQEIELDYQLGNISEDDYGTLREKYVRRALVALKSRYDREQELDEEIEASLQKIREKHD